MDYLPRHLHWDFLVKMPSDIMKVNVKLTGVFGKPVVTPVFGSGSADSTGGVKATAIETVKETATKQLMKER